MVSNTLYAYYSDQCSFHSHILTETQTNETLQSCNRFLPSNGYGNLKEIMIIFFLTLNKYARYGILWHHISNLLSMHMQRLMVLNCISSKLHIYLSTQNHLFLFLYAFSVEKELLTDIIDEVTSNIRPVLSPSTCKYELLLTFINKHNNVTSTHRSLQLSCKKYAVDDIKYIVHIT
ncbi:hypothetical protein KSF78_0009469 [Schistosoma japonicum]|nr:hypothetical protein KSF78_0009469 [Schistosoma japonicum]